MKIILASASPRRRELLKQIGWEFTVCVSNVEEKITKVLPQEVVEELSAQKAEDVANQYLAALSGRDESDKEECSDRQEDILVIGADTVVACGDQILGKPSDPADAVRMLTMLQGRAHYVYTGVTLILLKSGGNVCKKTFHEATKVNFYAMSTAEIAYYAHSPEPEGKAGSYAIQGLCARYIKGIEGDYNNVVGLPVGRLYQEVHEMTQSEQP